MDAQEAEKPIILCPFTVIADTREQLPYTFCEMPTRGADRGKRLVVPVRRGTVNSGDYSIDGMESRVAIERKSLFDLYSTLGQERDRFEREFERLNALEFAAVVVEADIRDIWRPKGGEEHERKAFETLYQAVLESCSNEAVAKLMAVLPELEARWQSHPGNGWRSKLNPKSVESTIVAWSIKYPRVHWWPMGSRRAAEIRVYGALEMFWRIDSKKA